MQKGITMKNKNFDTLGVMIDMSRNSVMSMEGLKRLIPLLEKMGYNMLMLYTEDTYEVDGEPYFGYMRGKYSKAEMKEIDAFAKSHGIKIIPCIQTLAHLDTATRWGKFPVDMGPVMMVDDPRNYEFIDHMFATLSECFESRLIHVGMDEAMQLGRGNHLDKYGYEPSVDIIGRHLKKVKEIAKKYDYEIMIWSDMYFRSWAQGKYNIRKTALPKEVIENYDPEVIPVYWSYATYDNDQFTDIPRTPDMLDNHFQLSKNTWYAGGIWTWRGFIPSNRYSIETMTEAVNTCKEKGVRNIFMTIWGNNGGECPKMSTYPALHYIAEISRENTDEASIKAKFKRIFGIDFDDFMKIDKPNEVNGYVWKYGNEVNPSKYMLYSDYFNGFLDYTVTLGDGAKYKKIAEELREVAKKSRKYSILFDAAAKLCDVLEYKYDLGVRTRAAYVEGDKEELKRLAENEYVWVAKRLKVYTRAAEKMWFYENKPCGYDIQDRMHGGIIHRTDACRRRLLDYVAGNIDSIPELEEKILPYPKATEGIPYMANNTQLYTSANRID